MIRNRWLAATLALGAGLGVVGAFGVLPAVGQSSPPSSPLILGNTAQIVDRGAAALPFALVACGSGDSAQLTISLNQKSGGGIASGSGFEQFTCTGQIQTVTVPVAANGKRFVKGMAFGQATVFECGRSFCGQASDSHSVTLDKK